MLGDDGVEGHKWTVVICLRGFRRTLAELGEGRGIADSGASTPFERAPAGPVTGWHSPGHPAFSGDYSDVVAPQGGGAGCAVAGVSELRCIGEAPER
jgi:hypothetical protein